MIETDNQIDEIANKIHTTELGIERIRKNLSLDEENVILWCKEFIKSKDVKILRKGKNFYITKNDIILTINANSYTVITAHKK